MEVDAVGSKGGLHLAWRGAVDIMLQSYSIRYIEVLIDDTDDGKNRDLQGSMALLTHMIGMNHGIF